MNSSVPKQYMDLCGKPVIAWTIEAFQNDGEITDIILVAGEEEIAYCREMITEKYGYDKVTRIVAGGKERGESVLRGLYAADPDTDYVLIHDGARPLIDRPCIARVIDAVRSCGAAIPGIPVKDTVKVTGMDNMVKETPDRRMLRLVQTPQAFSYRMILRAYEKTLHDGVHPTDDSMAAEYAGRTAVRIVDGSTENIKITTPVDRAAAEAILRDRIRFGQDDAGAEKRTVGERKKY